MDNLFNFTNLPVKHKKPILEKWSGKINKLLQIFQNRGKQIIILEDKFKGISNMGQFFDKLFELLVAYKYLDKKPIFCSEQENKPDIYLDKNNKYIEVKRINLSHKEKEKINNGYDFMVEKKNVVDKIEVLECRKKLYNKTKDHIDKALKQINSFSGIVYIIYQIDILTSPEQDRGNAQKVFEGKCREIFDNHKSSPNIELIVKEIQEF